MHSQFDVYAGGYYVGNTRNNLGVGNSYDIDHAILIADAGNTYQATGMLPSEMAERIKALEEGLRRLYDAVDSCVELTPEVLLNARTLLNPPFSPHPSTRPTPT